jgi:hypothetical protein
MRYRLRTLLIVAGVMPPLLALAWCKPVYLGLLCVFLFYMFITPFTLGVIPYELVERVGDRD